MSKVLERKLPRTAGMHCPALPGPEELLQFRRKFTVMAMDVRMYEGKLSPFQRKSPINKKEKHVPKFISKGKKGEFTIRGIVQI